MIDETNGKGVRRRALRAGSSKVGVGGKQSINQSLTTIVVCTQNRIFFGKTKLMSRALGTTPEDALADGIHALTPYLTGNVALLLTNRPTTDIAAYFANFAPVDFARAGTVAPRAFVIPPGVVYATGGGVPAEYDVPLGHTIEPELRRLGVPTRMVKGKVVLGGDESGEGSEGYVVCKEGDVLDSRQTRLLKLFDTCMSEFKVRVIA